MKIGLIDVDGHNFPNLALMKISSFYKRKGYIVEPAILGHYDKIYQSKVFTFTLDEDLNLTTADEIIKGGTGYDIKIELPEEIEHILPDYDLYNCEIAYGFLTRGCIRKCDFCIVPEKEGYIKPHSDITEFIGNKESVIIMDNNILASEHGLKQIEKIIDMKIKVDFNQGLDARIISKNPDIAKLLSKVKWLKPLRMACDTDAQIEPVLKAAELLRQYNTVPKNYFIYTLIKDVESGLKRVNILKDAGLDPFAMAFRSFENNYIEPELKIFARWVNHKAIFKSVLWEEYNK